VIYVVKLSDSIEVGMHIYEKGIGVTSIVTTNSGDRSLIGSYFNALKKALVDNDESRLEQFQNVTIIDSDGNAHEFETDLDALHKIQEQQEEPEFFDIYDS
jgi:hypothetical protein